MLSGIDRDHGLELVCVHAETGPEIATALISGEVVVAEMVPTIPTPCWSKALMLWRFYRFWTER